MLNIKNASADRKFWHKFVDLRDDLFSTKEAELVFAKTLPDTDKKKGIRVIAKRCVVEQAKERTFPARFLLALFLSSHSTTPHLTPTIRNGDSSTTFGFQCECDCPISTFINEQSREVGLDYFLEKRPVSTLCPLIYSLVSCQCVPLVSD